MGQFSDSKISQLIVHGNTTVQGTLSANQIFGINDYIFHGSNCTNDWNCQWLSTKPTFSSATDDSWYIADTDSSWNCGIISKHKFLRTPGLTLEWEHSSATTRYIMIGFIDDRNNYPDYTYAQSTTNLIYDNNGNNLEIYENAGLPYYYSRGSATGYHKYKIVLKNLGCDYYYDDVLVYNSVVNSTKYLRVHMSLNYGTVYFRNMRVYVNYDFILNGDRGVFSGGNVSASGPASNTIDYITISTKGNAVDFGDLVALRNAPGACSNGLSNRGTCGGGLISGSATNVIDYFTISSPGNASSFGILASSRYGPRGVSNNTNNRGIYGGGYTPGYVSVLDLITISTTGNASLIGYLVTNRYASGSCSSGTNDRGIFSGGSNGITILSIDYITISTNGGASSFGNLSVARNAHQGCSNFTNNRGVFSCGIDASLVNVMDYINISSTGTAIDFGDSIESRYVTEACSSGICNRGVFAGGQNASATTNVIECINIIAPSNAVDFGDLTVTRQWPSGCSNAN